MNISIVIPTLNAGNDIQRLIQAIQEYAHSFHYEIIVIDSSSKDNTVSAARNLGAEVIEIEPQAFNHGGTRNLGASRSKGEYIFFFTQDALPNTPAYFARMIDSLERMNAAGGHARQLPRHDASPLTKRDLAAWISGNETPRMMGPPDWDAFFRSHPIHRYYECVFDNVASVIRREVWEKIPFPITPFGEDIEWAYRAILAGHNVFYEPRATVIHSHDRSPRYEYKRTYIDHYRLHELFGLRAIPKRRGIISSLVKTTANDWAYLLKHYEMKRDWLRWMIEAPQNAWASAQGQYDGAKAAARGLPVHQSRDV